MANRTLTRANDARPEILEDGEPHNVGIWEEVSIERSAAGAPGILIVIDRYDSDMQIDQMCVSIPDGAAFLAPVNAWLNGNDPRPWVAGKDRASRNWMHLYTFAPRPGYSQNREDYA